jgi:hypothetical protein
MATVDHSNAHSAALKRAEAERKQEADEKAAVWGFVWTLFAFKVITVGVLLVWLDPLDFVKVASIAIWPFLIIPGVALAGPVGYRWRRRRVRRQLGKLKHAEFSTGDGSRNGREL